MNTQGWVEDRSIRSLVKNGLIDIEDVWSDLRRRQQETGQNYFAFDTGKIIKVGYPIKNSWLPSGMRREDYAEMTKAPNVYTKIDWRTVSDYTYPPSILNDNGSVSYYLDGHRSVPLDEWWSELCRVTANSYRKRLATSARFTKRGRAKMERFVYCVDHELDPDKRLSSVEVMLRKIRTA